MNAPFLDRDLEWDFRLPRVASINTSGHKYGLVYLGVGWVLWRDRAHLPEELVFNVNYLGGNMPTFALNFSRPGRRGLDVGAHHQIRLADVQVATVRTDPGLPAPFERGYSSLSIMFLSAQQLGLVPGSSAPCRFAPG